MLSVETLNSLADSEIENLPEDMQARLARFAQVIESFGLQALPPDATKHLADKLWELRLTGIHQKNQKTPKTELELARQRAKEVT